MTKTCPISKNPSESKCPMQDDTSCSSNAEVNRLNNMPSSEHLQQSLDPSSESLSTDRESSTIPRSDTDTSTNWMYPSPRMFYNALQRKNKGVPVGSIDAMLSVHNQLNESVWQELVEKEKYLHPTCEPKLKRFMGKPEDLSPTAWWHVKVRGGEAPFDRHDWIIDRCGCEVRYIIDYYSGHPEPGQATFNIDIRPALDSPTNILDRFRLFLRGHFK